MTFPAGVADFLRQKRIAVAGVSRSGKSCPGNLICNKLRAAGYQVFPINPHADSIDGEACYRELKAIGQPVDALVVTAPPAAAEDLVQQAHERGITRVWLHRSFGTGSISPRAVEFCREQSITVLAGGCPMMFCPPVDFGHKCMRWLLRWTGGLPR